ncbi:MAG: ROK family protein [Bacteroidota bacterium]
MTDHGPVLAIDIGGSKLMLGLVNETGEILAKVKRPFPPSITADGILRAIQELWRDLRGSCPNLQPRCAGVAIPGLADPRNGIWVHANFTEIEDLRIAALLEEELKIPVFIANDVNACAIGEKLYGACREVDDFLWITISNGIGGGLVLRGEIYEGAYRNAGEIGHLTVVEGGEWCRCGKQGCLEAYASGASIARRYAGRRHLSDPAAATAASIAEAARSGDDAARSIYAEAGRFLGQAISYAVNLLNPAKVILGGGVVMAFDLFRDELTATMRRMLFAQANQSLAVETTALSYNAALIGAAAIAWTGLRGKNHCLRQ